MDIHEIQEFLPHRYPFLMVDRVVECEPGKRLLAIKNVTYNEPFFQGHFPDHPIMPGVLILESMAQATGMLAFYSNKAISETGNVYYLVGIDKARFKKPVTAGDQLILEATLTKQLRGVYKFDVTAKVDGNLVATAKLMTTERVADS